MDDVVILEGAKIYSSIIDAEAYVGKNTVIGIENAGKEEITVIKKGTKVLSDAVINS